MLAAEVALRFLEDLAPLLAGVDGALDAGHLLAPQKLTHGRRVLRLDVDRLGHAALALRRLFLQDVTGESAPPPQFAGGGLLEALLGARMGFHLRHRDGY